MAPAIVISGVIVLLVLFTAVSGQIDTENGYGVMCSYFRNDTMSASIYILRSTMFPIEEIYFTNPLTLRNETIHYIKKESSSYTTYTNNSFFTAKRGPLKSAHMKYIPVYMKYIPIFKQTADVDFVANVDFCLTSISYKAILAIMILVPLFIIICCITACIGIGICAYKKIKRNNNRSSPLITTAGIGNDYGGTK